MTSMVAVPLTIARLAVPGVPIATRIELGGGDRVVRLTRTGGPRTKTTESLIVLGECYARNAGGRPDGPAAESDAQAIVDALEASPNTGPHNGFHILRWEGGGILDFEDPSDTRFARWQFTGTLHILR